MEFDLILKKLNNELSAKEQLEFDEWYKESRDHQVFFEKVLAAHTLEESSVDQEKAWRKIKSNLRRQKELNKRWKYAIAAILIVALGSTAFFNFTNQTSTKPSIASPVSNKIILTTEKGTDVELAADKIYKSDNVVGSGNQLVYKEDSVPSMEISYNSLTIPRGEQFSIRLSDKTKLWLNSDTKIKYPVRFIKNEPRVVEVIYGEVFFEVSSSADSNGANFFVKTKTQVIEVLGTEFNVKAYQEDNSIRTTLAEGEISLSNTQNNSKNILEPGFQGVYDPEKGNWALQKVNVENEISWKEGIYRFKNKELKEITATLSRWYDIEVEYTDEELQYIEFNGVFRKSQDLENILNILQTTGEVQYEIENDKITIKKQEQ